MTKRLLILSGLAILAVVCNHAAGWGFTAMVVWVDRYRPVVAPNFEQVGSLPYHTLLAVQQLTAFSVPAFLFVSGFFVAYAARGSQSTLRWKTVITRIRNLLMPFAIWSAVIFAGDALQGRVYGPLDYAKRLLLGKASEPYFYVPLLCQFYLLSPLLVPVAKARGRLVLLASALLQLSTIGLRYLSAYGSGTPILAFLIRTTPTWAFPSWTFFFVLGVVSAFHIRELKQWLLRWRWSLFGAAVVLGLTAILEPQAPLQGTEYDWARALSSISSNLYAVAFLLCFLAFDGATIPGSKTLNQLGRSSYGIYLLHPALLEFFARVIRQVTPWMLAYQVVFSSLLVTTGVGIPLLFMTAVARSPARRFHRHLFG